MCKFTAAPRGDNVNEFIPSYTRPNVNRQVILSRRPSGIPASDDFSLAEVPVPAMQAGQFLVRNLYLSVDPVQRGWAANPAMTTVGMAMRGLAVGVVVASLVTSISEGDIVYGQFGWQDYAVATPGNLMSRTVTPQAPVSTYAGVLGMPGVTAWLALMDLAPPQPGQTVLVSTAAGAVGSVVGQICRARGAHAVGLTGNDAKVARCISRFGYEQAFNYQSVSLAETLAAAAPGGLNTYFDNTGGTILDTALRAMAKNGRIIQCGTAATASWTPPPTGLRNEREILTRALTWSGFFIFDHIGRFPAVIAALTEMLQAGRLTYDEDIEHGIERASSALETVFAGGNDGKKLIAIGDA